MVAKVIKQNKQAINTVQWPVQNVQAISTTCINPFFSTTINQDITNAAKNSFGDFNLGDHVGDDPVVVENNKQSLLKILPENTKIQWLKQVHGGHVHALTEYSEQKIEADAVVTSLKNVALSVMTADCLPIFLADKNGREIAAIHGGWKPLVKNIISTTIDKMSFLPEQLYAWLGPCIGEHAFEVGAEVKQAFIQQSPAFKKAFVTVDNRNNKKYVANLQRIASIQLQQCGIHHISVLPHCTYNRTEQYYSYRRENITGRMASIICRL